MSAAVFNYLSVNSAPVAGLRSLTFDERERDDARSDDGTRHETSRTVMRTAPRMDFVTVAVRSLFLSLGTGDEVPFLALDGTNGAVAIAVRDDTAGPGTLAGANHPRRRLLNGLLMLDRLSWRADDVWEAGCSIFGRSSSGSTDPVTRDLVAAPTPLINTERLVTTSVIIGGSPIDQVQSWDIEIAHRVENSDGSVCYDWGLPYPTKLTMPGHAGATEIKLTLDTLNTHTPVSNGATSITGSVLNHLGVGVSANTATVTINGAFARQRRIDGPRGTAARRIEIFGTFDGSNRPLTIATA